MKNIYNSNLITMDTAVEILLQKDESSIQEIERINKLISKANEIYRNVRYQEQ